MRAIDKKWIPGQARNDKIWEDYVRFGLKQESFVLQASCLQSFKSFRG
jgi:hypothetical protein